jgi:adenine-specific DNA-methyltransferase
MSANTRKQSELLLSFEEDRRNLGAVYTPSSLAEWVAALVADECATLEPTVLDFGCGEGALLAAMSKVRKNAKLIGVDTNKKAVASARKFIPTKSVLLVDDVLNPKSKKSYQSVSQHWIEKIGGSPDALIMNPPWGAVHSLNREAAAIDKLSLAIGQFDTYDLFCELGLQVLRHGSVFGLILPDSLLLPEHKALRKLLLANRLSFIARLGEGVFPGVYSGCIVIVGALKPAPSEHLIECLRLTKQNRQSIAKGSTFEECRQKLSHLVPQSRFTTDPEVTIDLDVTSKDQVVYKIAASAGNWTEFLNSRRGVELSKHGRVLQCGACGSYRPLPKDLNASCFYCGATASIQKSAIVVAESPKKQGRWERFLVGEDVERYALSVRRWIKCDLPGINYKHKSAVGVERLLVRKTGIGINATLESSGVYTNQVVFEYTLNDPNRFSFSYLHYVLGVLSSRSLFAYHIKRGGDLEWRSHPYVTQKTLGKLPIPVPVQGTHSWKQAGAIADAVKSHLVNGKGDLQIEGLVAGLYGLTPDELKWALQVLDSSANLDAMRRLRLASNIGIMPTVAI